MRPVPSNFCGEWAKLGGRRGRVRVSEQGGTHHGCKYFVEATFDNGESRRRTIGRFRREPNEFGCENLGLLLDDAKTLLRRLQEAIVHDQFGEALEARQECNDCGRQRAIHDDRGRVFDTLYGRI